MLPSSRCAFFCGCQLRLLSLDASAHNIHQYRNMEDLLCPCSFPPPQNSLLTHPLHYVSVKHKENYKKRPYRSGPFFLLFAAHLEEKRITAVLVGRFGSQTRNISKRQSPVSEKSTKTLSISHFSLCVSLSATTLSILP